MGSKKMGAIRRYGQEAAEKVAFLFKYFDDTHTITTFLP